MFISGNRVRSNAGDAVKFIGIAAALTPGVCSKSPQKDVDKGRRALCWL